MTALSDDELRKMADWFRTHNPCIFNDNAAAAINELLDRRSALASVPTNTVGGEPVASLNFLPLGDNHHNAEAYPYCNPNGWKLQPSPTRDSAEGREKIIELQALLKRAFDHLVYLNETEQNKHLQFTINDISRALNQQTTGGSK